MRKISSYLNTNLKPSLDKYMLLSLFILLVWVFYPTLPATASSTDNVSGYAWSETIGWISFNCIDTASCGSSDYGVNIDFATDNVSGYAWSEHIGWISFERATTNNPPQAPFNTGSGPIARYNSGTGMLEGWARALSGCENTPGTPLSPCPQTSAGGASGGWDGWIKLSGTATNGSPYGVSVSSSGDASGFAWGSAVVGWVDFSLVSVIMPGAPSVFINASQNPVNLGDSTTLNWTTTNMVSCTASGDWSGPKTVNASFSESTGPLTVNSVFTLDCVGTDGLNYSDFVPVAVNSSLPVPVGSISAGSCEILAGQSTCNSSVTWSTTNATNPEVYQGSNLFSTVPSDSQNRSVSYGSNTFYLRDGGTDLGDVTVNAGCASGSTWNGSACVATPPPPPPPTLNSLSLTANPNIIRSGRTSTLNITVDSQATLACYLSGGINESFIHYGSVSKIQTYTRTTNPLQSTQIVKVKCDSTPGITLGTDETRITVIPTVQEI